MKQRTILLSPVRRPFRDWCPSHIAFSIPFTIWPPLFWDQASINEQTITYSPASRDSRPAKQPNAKTINSMTKKKGIMLSSVMNYPFHVTSFHQQQQQKEKKPQKRIKMEKNHSKKNDKSSYRICFFLRFVSISQYHFIIVIVNVTHFIVIASVLK